MNKRSVSPKTVLLQAGIFLMAVFVFSGVCKPRTPGPADKCAVCGMFVAKYPEFLAQVSYKNGPVFFFDGPKDFFIFVNNPSHYGASVKARERGETYVTDYYSQKPIPADSAWYVAGSDMLGPMGKELIPFRSKKDAVEFQGDHGGAALLRSVEVTADVLRKLDK
jgi:nitrous oxide reductase accessory protein NosL